MSVSSNAYPNCGVYDGDCRHKAVFNFPNVRFLLALPISSYGSGLDMEDRRESDRHKEERRKEQERRQEPRETPDRREKEPRKGERRTEQ